MSSVLSSEEQIVIRKPDGFEPATWDGELHLLTIFFCLPLLIPLRIHSPGLILFASVRKPSVWMRAGLSD